MKTVSDTAILEIIMARRKSQGFPGVIPKSLARKAAEAMAATKKPLE